MLGTESYVIFPVYPASSKAFWYSSLAPSNSSSELEMVFNLFSIEIGMFLRMDGRWLDALLMYLVIPFGFHLPFIRSKYQTMVKTNSLLYKDKKLVHIEYYKEK